MSGRSKARGERDLNRVFQALANPDRRKILALLRESGELKVGDVGRAFSMTQNGVSKHLKVLEAAGLVRRRVEGRIHWISIDLALLEPARAWLDSHYHFWNQRLEALGDFIKPRPPSSEQEKS
jgi:DNA-binding transcriptional ArsR family regulator